MDTKINAQKIIAIDGPAGSGKSTVAHMLALRLGFLYLNTGAMYRALTLKVLNSKICLEDIPAINRLLPGTAVSFKIDADGTSRILLDHEDVTSQTRGSEVTRNVSAVSAIPEVRQFMVRQQRHIACGNRIVVEGRDITTVVFPDAEFKFYIDADIDTRARRCVKDWRSRGIDITLEQMKTDLIRRDHIDSTREVAPLKKSTDALVIDTTNLTPDQVIDPILSHISNPPHH